MAKHCYKCLGVGWVCENHPGLPWSDQRGCTCGAGMPCECNRAGEAETPDVSQVLTRKKSRDTNVA
jgi:hypothetical protein